MSEHNHQVKIRTPFGVFDGKAVIDVNGTDVSGTIVYMGTGNDFPGGTYDADGNIAFGGDLLVPIGRIGYSFSGTFRDGMIDGAVKTIWGNIFITSK